MIAFGPIPSRRLGYSLGINNIPPKSCSYDCLYCQVGRTNKSEYLRREFYSVDQVVDEVGKQINNVVKAGGKIDYLTFVPDGEPTLDINLGAEINALKKYPYKLAVITNGSLLGMEHVQRDLAKTDLVSIKVDSVDEVSWKKINRPHPNLKLANVQAGIIQFADHYRGEIITETMLLSGINDDDDGLKTTARFLQQLHPEKVYIAIPTRPTAEQSVSAPNPLRLTQAYQIFSQYLPYVELLTGFSEEAFTPSGDLVEELLNITAVHPMRKTEAVQFLKSAGSPTEILDNLVEGEKLLAIEHEGEKFYLRKHQFAE